MRAMRPRTYGGGNYPRDLAKCSGSFHRERVRPNSWKAEGGRRGRSSLQRSVCGLATIEAIERFRARQGRLAHNPTARDSLDRVLLPVRCHPTGVLTEDQFDSAILLPAAGVVVAGNRDTFTFAQRRDL